jgi:hypothetical protein
MTWRDASRRVGRILVIGVLILGVASLVVQVVHGLWPQVVHGLWSHGGEVSK